nr:NXPE family member 3-like [Labrus bergylta]
MWLKGFTSNHVNMKLLKTCVILLLVYVLFFTLRNMALLQINFEENSIIFLKKVTSAPSTGPVLAPYMPDNFCTIKPLSSADAKEERLLLDSIAWPETPPLPAPFSLNQTSNAAHSTFTILPRRGGGDWHVGDQLEVIIQMYNFQGNPKKSGGDAIVARLHNRALEAGVAGRVVDLLMAPTLLYSLYSGKEAHRLRTASVTVLPRRKGNLQSIKTVGSLDSLGITTRVCGDH